LTRKINVHVYAIDYKEILFVARESNNILQEEEYENLCQEVKINEDEKE
jgi:hypothetical protein